MRKIIKAMILVCISIFICLSCSNNSKNAQIDSIQVVYLKGDIESPILFDRNRISNFNRRAIKDTVIINKEVIKKINHLLLSLKEQNNYSSFPDCDFRIHCKVNYDDKKIKDLYIGTSNCIVLGDKNMSINDSLVYLIRKETGYYNYFSKEEMILHEELNFFELPSNHKELSNNTGIFPRLIE